MRELKFRAFVEVNGKPLFTYSSDIGLLAFFRKFEYNKNIEQYTGLKDKNGEEIYEGDIVEYDWYIVGDKPAYRVEGQVVLDDLGARADGDRIRYCTNVEVIGNIHENPELLKGEE